MGPIVTTISDNGLVQNNYVETLRQLAVKVGILNENLSEAGKHVAKKRKKAIALNNLAKKRYFLMFFYKSFKLSKS